MKKPENTKNSKVPKSHGHAAKVKSRRRLPVEIVYWSLVLIALGIWGWAFGSKFYEFYTTVDDIEERLMAEISTSKGHPLIDDADNVLGVSDDVDYSQTSEDNSLNVLGDDTSDDDPTDTGTQTDAEIIANAVDEIEQERVQKLRDMLLLQLPDEIDNPNYPLTFVEPTELGVEIQIDGGGFSQKKSPYQLPSLVIGKHILNFRFKDTEDVTQNLEVEVTVIPRVPKFDDAQSSNFETSANVEFTGTALPNSKLVYITDFGKEDGEWLAGEVGVDGEGMWTIQLTDHDSSGTHKITCFVRKDGYASNFSDIFEFSIGKSIVDIPEAGDKEKSKFDLSSLSWDSITSEQDYLLLGAIIFVAVFAVFVLLQFFRVIFRRRPRSEDYIVGKPSTKDGETAEAKTGSMTLREKFAKAGLLPATEAEEETPSESSSDEHKKDKKSETMDNKADGEGAGESAEKKPGNPELGKVYSKDEFLNKFKDAEGDSEAHGKKSVETDGNTVSEKATETESTTETKPKSGESKKVKITLTSKD